MIHNLIEKISTSRKMRYVPWYALGCIGGSISFMGLSGVSLLYTIFIFCLCMLSFIKSWFDYKINADLNFVIRDVGEKIKRSNINFVPNPSKVCNRNLRNIYTLSMLFHVATFIAYMLILSLAVNAIIFWNLPLMATTITHAVIASLMYYMVTFLLNVMSQIKVKEL